MKTYFILEATESNGVRRTILIDESEYFGMASDYFVPGSINARHVGTVQIDGDTEFLHDTYVSE